MPENQESLDLSFPGHGVDVSIPFNEQREGTTRIGRNVRLCDPLLERDRGGSRPGLTRYPNDDLPDVIQHLNQLVIYQPEYTLANFEDFQTGYTNGDPNYPNFYYRPGGSGFVPFKGMTPLPRRRVTVTVNVNQQVNGANVTVTAVLSRFNLGTFVAGATVFLVTDPRGRDGDGESAVTNASGVAVFTVTEPTYNGQVRYIVYNTYTPPP